MKGCSRKLTAIILMIALTLSFFTITASAAPEIDKETVNLCKAWMLVDATSGSVIAKSDSYQNKISPASTTKILTAIVTLDECSLDEKVEVDPRAVQLGSGSSKCGLIANETVTIKDLLYGMMLVSGNDAALAVAYHISGSVEEFVALMNKKAKEIGMDHSHFANPHGLDDDDHYVTCEDMAKLALYAMGYDELMKACKTASYELPKTNGSAERLINSTNKLIYTPDSDSVSYKYPYATGLKTGSTYRGGGCIVATAQKDAQKLIALVFGDPTDGGVNRWKIARYLLDYGFNNYTTLSIGEQMKNLEIYADIQDASDPELSAQIKLDVEFPKDMVVTLDNADLGDSPEFTYKIESNAPLKTPVSKGEAAATVKYLYGGNEVYESTSNYSQSLESIAEANGKEGIVSKIDTDKISKENTLKDYSVLWWWLVIPGAGIVFIIIRMMIKNRHPKRKYAKKMTAARTPGYRHKRHKYRAPSPPANVRRRKRGAPLRKTRVRTASSSTSRSRRRYR